MYFLFEESQFDVAFFATSPGALCQNDFSKGKKKIFPTLFSPALTTSCGHAISVFLQKHSTDIVYRWHIYQDTMLFPSNGGQAICIHSHWGIWIHQCFAESENSTLKGFKVPLTLLPYKRYRLTPVYYK